ncbi:carbonic anhydrase [Patulibacter brassicae]|jgi:carbonic anhydrase|uniref:carbonic anhydrase n=1 Tax=Patulibacter brassicae TaxID=1705717 RepID=A0ABU4VLM2_9ACTN|nr:carbonic anhydrase [Patulibacter brassicae]MDX8152722.1 carbonic anhydrase [Patulibacter brassicae]
MTDAQHDPQSPDLIAHSAAFRERYTPYDTPRPRRRVAVVACMDARLDLFGLFGLEIGDAHLIRNAGGVVTDDVIRSLAISQRKLGTREVLLVHHTQCGMLSFTDDELRNELLEETGYKPPWSPESFVDLDADLTQSLRRVRTSPFLPHVDAVRGFVFQVEDGTLREVVLPDED